MTTVRNEWHCRWFSTLRARTPNAGTHPCCKKCRRRHKSAPSGAKALEGEPSLAYDSLHMGPSLGTSSNKCQGGSHVFLLVWPHAATALSRDPVILFAAGQLAVRPGVA